MMTSTATAQPVTTTQPNVFQQSAGALNTGIGAATGAAGYQPTMITPQGMNTQAFMNPYQQQVTDLTMQQMADQQAKTMNTLDAQAGAAGAFGGSRHGVAMGESMGQYADAQAATLAGLNSQNFLNAQQMGMQTQMANQQAGLAGAGLNLSAAGQLGNLSNLGFGQGMTINNQQSAMGSQIQAMNQQLIDAAKGQYAGFTGQPAQSLAMLLGGSQVPTGQTQTGTQSYSPGLFDYLSLGMTAAG